MKARGQKFFEVFDGQQISQTTFILDFGSKAANKWALRQVCSALLPANGGGQNGR
jgi:hypothetical protein